MGREILGPLLAPALIATLAASRPAPVLTIFAAASLRDAFSELGGRFERQHPGARVRFNFAGSQQLALQLQHGARGDVFASADQRWMRAVVEHGLTAGPARTFAHNRLIVIVPAGTPAGVARLEDLARPGVRLVLAAEAVPAGKYSREVLGRLSAAPGFGRDYAQRVLRNVVSEEENVRLVLGRVQLGEADAGMVYRSDLTPASARRVGRIEIPDRYNVLASYQLALLKDAPEKELARAFVTLVLSAEGQATLGRHGWVPVTRPAPADSGTR